MTQKKMRQMKQNGGGGWFSSLKLSQPEPEPVDILFITTHGEYAEPKMVEFQSPINKIHKINVAAIGECCALSPNWTEYIKYGLSELLTSGEDMETKSERIILSLKVMEKHIKEAGATMGINTDIKTIIIEKGDKIVDKEYSIDVQEGLEDISPYFDTITLLSKEQGAVPNLLKVIRGMPTRNSEVVSIKLSEILQYIKNNFPKIINLIIVDGSCSPVLDTRCNRNVKRNVKKGNVNAGGNYKNKSIGKLKNLEKTNNKKHRNTKTKWRKTRKMRQRLNK